MNPKTIIKQIKQKNYRDYMNLEYNIHCQKKFNKDLDGIAKKIELENLLTDIAKFNIKSLKKHKIISSQIEKDIDKLDSDSKDLDSEYLEFLKLR
jgi:hypothetical protein